MAANALEEKINKIKLQNEEIKRRYEEVEADKKNAAKLNALVQMVPSSDWPERKEPPEFTRKETNKSNIKQPKLVKEHTDRPQQYLIGGAEGKKIHKFAQGDGPPPDPKYNFLADSEREENNVEGKKDEDKHKGTNKYVRNGPRKRGGGRDGYQKDHRKVPTASRDGHLPEYDAWRAERHRIDEARINRQRTAEGNWRREWDNDKGNIEKESSKKDPRFSSGDTSRRDYKEFEKRHQFEAEHSNRGRGGNHRNSHGPRTHGHYDNQQFDYQNEYSEAAVKGSLSPTDDRSVMATDKSIKVTLNHGNTPVKGPVMSVKVNAPSIAGTGRVGPRQKTRVTYSSQSEAEISTHQIDNFFRQKSFDEKTHFNNAQRTIAPKSPFTSRRKESNKSPYLQRKDIKRDEQSIRPHGENSAKSPSTQKKKFKDTQKSPQAQMQFFTSSSQGLVSSRGRGQKRLNEAKSTVIKILGQTIDNNQPTILHPEEVKCHETTKVDIDNVAQNVELQEKDVQNEEITKIIEETENKDIAQVLESVIGDFSKNVIDEIVIPDLSKLQEEDLKESIETIHNLPETEGENNLKNQIGNDEGENQVISENVTFESETLNKETKEVNDFLVNTRDDISDVSKNAQNERMEESEIAEKHEMLEKNEVLEKREMLEKNEVLEKSEVLKKSEVLEESEIMEKIESVDINKIENTDNKSEKKENSSVSNDIEESKATEKVEEVKICDNENNESKIEDTVISKLQISESVEDVSKNICELESQSTVKSSENVSAEISNEASCVPSE